MTTRSHRASSTSDEDLHSRACGNTNSPPTPVVRTGASPPPDHYPLCPNQPSTKQPPPGSTSADGGDRAAPPASATKPPAPRGRCSRPWLGAPANAGWTAPRRSASGATPHLRPAQDPARSTPEAPPQRLTPVPRGRMHRRPTRPRDPPTPGRHGTDRNPSGAPPKWRPGGGGQRLRAVDIDGVPRQASTSLGAGGEPGCSEQRRPICPLGEGEECAEPHRNTRTSTVRLACRGFPPFREAEPCRSRVAVPTRSPKA